MTVRRMCYGCNKYFNAKGDEVYCPKCAEELANISAANRQRLLAPEQYKLELEFDNGPSA